MENEKIVNGHRVKTGEPGENGTKSNGRHILKQRWAKRQQDNLQLAEVNRVARELRTPEQQLAELDKRLGHWVGADKERARLQIEIYDGMSLRGKEYCPLTREQLLRDLEIAKMASRGYREMRKFGLSPRTLKEYDEEKYAAQFVA